MNLEKRKTMIKYTKQSDPNCKIGNSNLYLYNLIFQTLNFASSNSQSFKHERFTSSCLNIRVKKLKFLVILLPDSWLQHQRRSQL